ncbi:MAG: phage baseplate assembly protein [Gammaproteobacteria bacterium]|nr:phage baseplate assembly protein [Gammaproteobacteria bacterium]
MSIGPLQNAMRLQALRSAANTFGVRSGTVTSYNPNKYAAKVTLQPDSLMTGWLPVASLWVGNGWGLFTPPSPGDQVNVEFVDGDVGAGTVTSRIWDNNNRPLAVPAAECWLVHKSGSFIKFTNDGKLTLSDAHGATLQLDGAGNIVSQATQWTHTGPMHVTGNVQVDQTLTANTDVVGGGKSLKNHTHPDPQGGNVGPPN